MVLSRCASALWQGTLTGIWIPAGWNRRGEVVWLKKAMDQHRTVKMVVNGAMVTLHFARTADPQLAPRIKAALLGAVKQKAE